MPLEALHLLPDGWRGEQQLAGGGRITAEAANGGEPAKLGEGEFLELCRGSEGMAENKADMNRRLKLLNSI